MSSGSAAVARPRLPSASRARFWGLAVVLLGALALLVGLTGCTSVGLGRTASEGARLSFQQREHDFGKLSASQKTEHRFAFTNAGSQQLEISDIGLEPARPGG